MKRLNLILIAVISSAMMFTTSCKKEQGCTDPDSVNYSSTAEEDDGSCKYEGRAVLWYGKATSDSLYYYGSDGLTFYVDGDVVGSSMSDIYYTSAPDCGQDGTITVTKDLGSDKSKAFPYKVVDDLGEEIWTGNITFEANTCLATELTWN